MIRKHWVISKNFEIKYMIPNIKKEGTKDRVKVISQTKMKVFKEMRIKTGNT